ncbi:hypothetical protein ACJMK2_011635 [Sinanodonta woodiana]|uniref:Uncharacterized protein n=1 Tax=Sinanodonta woodiana TaxID=1069815 RepID=A0ABD3V5L9_SINWO
MGIKLTMVLTVLTFGVHFNKRALGQWSSWSSCSASCGHGTRYNRFSTESCNNWCYNGGIIENSYCNCPAGTTGPCCDDIPECASSPCQHEGTCIELINRYNCSCTIRYYGPNCENDLLWDHYSACQFEYSRCFRVFQHRFDWHGAQEFCRRREGRLAVLDTAEKQYFLETALRTLEIDENSSEFWIGASKNGNGLQWITGSAVVNDRWPPGVGNGIHGFGCLALSTHYSFMWNELYCATSAYFICEEGSYVIEPHKICLAQFTCYQYTII